MYLVFFGRRVDGHQGKPCSSVYFSTHIGLFQPWRNQAQVDEVSLSISSLLALLSSTVTVSAHCALGAGAQGRDIPGDEPLQCFHWAQPCLWHPRERWHLSQVTKNLLFWLSKFITLNSTSFFLMCWDQTSWILRNYNKYPSHPALLETTAMWEPERF